MSKLGPMSKPAAAQNLIDYSLIISSLHSLQNVDSHWRVSRPLPASGVEGIFARRSKRERFSSDPPGSSNINPSRVHCSIIRWILVRDMSGFSLEWMLSSECGSVLPVGVFSFCRMLLLTVLRDCPECPHLLKFQS